MPYVLITKNIHVSMHNKVVAYPCNIDDETKYRICKKRASKLLLKNEKETSIAKSAIINICHFDSVTVVHFAQICDV